MELSGRQRQILEAIVQEYILSVEPISSKLIDKKYDFGISTATIRNEMAILEQLKFLEHPHTSAGRVPTTKGYRMYVNGLLSPEDYQPLADSGQQQHHQSINSELPENLETERTLKNICVKETKEVLREITRLLSEITNYISITLMPPEDNIVIKHFDLFKMSKRAVLLVAVAANGDVFKELIMLEYDLNDKILQKIENIINKLFAEKNVSTIKNKQIDTVQLGLPKEYNVFFNRLRNLFQTNVEDRLFIGGIENLMFWPKHKAVNTQDLIIIFDNRLQIIDFFNELEKENALTVKIGSEMSEISDDFSFVGASYRIGDLSAGMVGLIGPCYMHYPRAISTVKFFANNLSTTFEKII